MEKVAILNFGDSQGEIWDYVFCNNDNYIKYKDNKNIGWRSGWSTRGLKKIEHQNRLFGEIPKLYKNYKNMIIILTFGSTDIEWNLSYKRFINNEFPNTEIFINEMKNTLINTLDTYLEIEKNLKDLNINIIICFPYIPLPITDEYMKNFSKKTNSIYYKVIDHNERISLWNNYCNKVTNEIKSNKKYDKKIHIFDLRENFLNKGLDYFSRKDCQDHHPDLSISQYLLTNLLDNHNFYTNNYLSFNIKYNNWKFDFMYPHLRRPFI